MKSLIETSITAYKISCKEFIRQYSLYIKNHVKVKNVGVFEVFSEDIEIPFKYLSDVLHWAVSVYDTFDKRNVDSEDKTFMSGVKCIDNMTKHQKDYKDCRLWDFVRPVPQYSTKINKVIDEETVNVGFEMTLRFMFQDISGIQVDPKFQKQKDNYIDAISGKEVNDIISNIDKILKKHIDLGKMI